MQNYRFLSIAIIFLLQFTNGACQKKMSEYFYDEQAGFNGGFEIRNNNLPVNWILYTPATVPKANFKLGLSADATEGKNSLFFDVISCQNIGGWLSPGIAKEINANSGDTVTIRINIKNTGGTYRLKLNGITPKKAAPGMDTIVTQSHNWVEIEKKIIVPSGMKRIRFEFNVLSAGKCWLDNARIDTK